MNIARDIATTRAALHPYRHAGKTIGLVPTMGALHRGHLTLLETARAACDVVVATIFVNPTQFGPGEDYAAYPRTEQADHEACRRAGVDLIFQPTAEEMYPPAARTTVSVAELDQTLCGPHRPGHFAGVATVVTKLFQIVQPTHAYFGRKDFQQLAIIRRFTRDLNMPLEIIGVPTVRESDGLAMSSRNAYLEPEHRAQAPVVYEALQAVATRIRDGEADRQTLEQHFRTALQQRGPLEIEYASIVDPDTLQPSAAVRGAVLLATAVRIGKTRLIDNLEVDPTRSGD